MDMRSVHLRTSHVRGVMFPDTLDTVTPWLNKKGYLNYYIDKLFDSQISYFNPLKFTDRDDLAGVYTPIEVKLIMTDVNRTGIWLLFDRWANKVTIPGGYVDAQDVEYIRDECGISGDGLLIVQQALIRELYFGMYGNNGIVMYDDSKLPRGYLSPSSTFDAMLPLQRVITSRFSIDNTPDPLKDLWYTYRIPGDPLCRSLTFYYVVEVGSSRTYSEYGNNIPIEPKEFIWLNKDNWRLAKRCKRKSQYWETCSFQQNPI